MIKRRRVLQTIVTLPAAPALPAMAQRSAPPGGESNEMPRLAETAPNGAAEPMPTFFTVEQRAALRRLAELIVPKSGERPGASEAGAADFLDFLISQSNPERQQLYRSGLDRLNASKPFAQLSEAEARAALKPLTEAWTYHPPKDSFARFLREAKEDLIQATLNSREYARAMARRSRSASGQGAYWLPFD